MKIKRVILVTLMLLAILTIGAVSAQDNITEETLTVEEKLIEEPINDSLKMADSCDEELKGEDVQLIVTHDRIMTKDDSISIVSNDINGNISILIDNLEVYHDGDFWYGSFFLSDLIQDIDYGNHSLEVKYLGSRYSTDNYNPTFYNASFIYSYVKVAVYSDKELVIYSEEEMDAKLYLDDDLIYDGKINDDTSLYNEKLFSGYVPKYTLITSGKGKYKSLTLTDSVQYEIYPDIEVPDTMGQGDNKYIKFELPHDADGNLKVYLNDIDVNASFEKGKSIIPLNKLDIGDYDVHITYNSDSKYESCDEDYHHIKVTHNPNFKVTVPVICYVFGSTISFTSSNDIEGKISIHVDYENIYTADFKNGVAKINISDTKTGLQTYQYTFEGTCNGEYLEYKGEFNITLVLFTVSVPKTVYAGQSFKVTFTAPSNINGEISCSKFKNDDVIYYMNNGKGTFSVNGLNEGINTIEYDFYTANYDYIVSYFKVNVIKPPIIKAKDFKMDYSSKKTYRVRILDNQSKSVGAGKTVVFYIYLNGKKISTKTVKTDSRGYAKVYFKMTPNTYKVKIKYGFLTVTKKYTVKSIVKYKKIQKFKRYIPGVSQRVTSKKFNFEITLKKVDGKYLKGKKIKLVFYKSDYLGKLTKLKSVTKKTNSKGVVKISYKKLPFKVTQNEFYGVIEVKISYLKDNQWANLNIGSLSPISYYFI